MYSNIQQKVLSRFRTLIVIGGILLAATMAIAQSDYSGGTNGFTGSTMGQPSSANMGPGAAGSQPPQAGDFVGGNSACANPGDNSVGPDGAQLPPCPQTQNQDDSQQQFPPQQGYGQQGYGQQGYSQQQQGYLPQQQQSGQPLTTSAGPSTLAGPQGFGPGMGMGMGGQGLGNSLNAQSLGSIQQTMQQLGLSPDELSTLKNQMASGSLSPDDIQELCLHLAAKQLGPNDIAAVARSLGLTFSEQQLDQLRSCTQLTQPENSPTGAPTTSMTAPGMMMRSQVVSSIEQNFRSLGSGMAPLAPNTRNLGQFGYSMFSARMATLAPVGNVPVGHDYMIGPDDQIKMLMWGRINNTLNLTVGRDGSVLIPEMGPLQVAGLTFDETKKLIEDKAGQITGVKVDVTMGKLRTIQVFVVGEVEQPGALTVSALAHVSNALAASGGITKIGSLRRIELRRGNQLVKVVDLYGLLLNGNTEGDEQLEAGDVIFVPVIGPVAGVIGDVKRPAIYEISRSGETLSDVVRLAGGISAFGYSQRVQVERVESHEKRIALDVDLNEMRSQRFEIRDGDLIKVYPVLPTEHDIVMVRGNVNRPGKYQWHPGMRVGDLVEEAEGVAPHTFFKYALIRRKEGPEKTTKLVPVDLGEAMSDHLSGPDNLALFQEDELTVFSESQMKYLPTVEVFGEVRNPGYYVLSQGMRVSDLVYLAGGLRDDAYQKSAELARTQVVNGATTSHTFEDIDLRAALEGSDVHNPVLVANDQVFVRRASNWHLPWVVMVRGEVARPGPYTIHDGERIASVLERAGGLLPEAYLPATVLIRQSIKELQQQRLDEARHRLQESILRAQLKTASAAMQSGSDQSKNMMNSPEAIATMEKVLSDTQNTQAQGRLVIHMRPLDELANSPDNVALNDQDQLLIPRRPAAINVLGQVYSPNAIVYRPGLTTRDYLEQAGGPNEGADPDHIMVIKADGSVLTEDGIKASKQSTMFPLLPVISGGLMTAKLDPGDTVYVPERLIYVNKLQETATIAQIVANAATTLAVVGLLATNL
jgi:protein involved in polysaccharide export with SLBB domain/AraC-like DNA-binding protein